MLWPVNPRRGKTTNWRAGCGKTASPVRRGEGRKPMRPSYPIDRASRGGNGRRGRHEVLLSLRDPDACRVRATVCRACSTAWGCKSPAQPDGGEVLAKRKGVSARRRLKEAWSKTMTRRTEIGYEAGRSGRASGGSRSPSPSRGRPCRSGGCVAKAVELTSGDLRGVPATGLRTSQGA